MRWYVFWPFKSTRKLLGWPEGSGHGRDGPQALGRGARRAARRERAESDADDERDCPPPPAPPLASALMARGGGRKRPRHKKQKTHRSFSSSCRRGAPPRGARPRPPVARRVVCVVWGRREGGVVRAPRAISKYNTAGRRVTPISTRSPPTPRRQLRALRAGGGRRPVSLRGVFRSLVLRRRARPLVARAQGRGRSDKTRGARGRRVQGRRVRRKAMRRARGRTPKNKKGLLATAGP